MRPGLILLACASLLLSGCGMDLKKSFPFDAEVLADVERRLEEQPLIVAAEAETMSEAAGFAHSLRVIVHGAPDQPPADARATVEQARATLTDMPGNVWGVVLMQQVGGGMGRIEFRNGAEDSFDDLWPLIDAAYEELGNGASSFTGRRGSGTAVLECTSTIAGDAAEAVALLYADPPESCDRIVRERSAPTGETYAVPSERPLSPESLASLDELFTLGATNVILSAGGLLNVGVGDNINDRGVDDAVARILSSMAAVEEVRRVSIDGFATFDVTDGVTAERRDSERAVRIAEMANG